MASTGSRIGSPEPDSSATVLSELEPGFGLAMIDNPGRYETKTLVEPPGPARAFRPRHQQCVVPLGEPLIGQ